MTSLCSHVQTWCTSNVRQLVQVNSDLEVVSVLAFVTWLQDYNWCFSVSLTPPQLFFILPVRVTGHWDSGKNTELLAPFPRTLCWQGLGATAALPVCFDSSQNSGPPVFKTHCSLFAHSATPTIFFQADSLDTHSPFGEALQLHWNVGRKFWDLMASQRPALGETTSSKVDRSESTSFVSSVK